MNFKKISNVVAYGTLILGLIIAVILVLFDYWVDKINENTIIYGKTFFEWKGHIFYNYFKFLYKLVFLFAGIFFTKKWWLRIILFILPIILWVYGVHVFNQYNPW